MPSNTYLIKINPTAKVPKDRRDPIVIPFRLLLAIAPPPNTEVAVVRLYPKVNNKAVFLFRFLHQRFERFSASGAIYQFNKQTHLGIYPPSQIPNCCSLCHENYIYETPP